MDVRIFVSYSHRDQEYVAQDELLGFLRGLEHDGDVHFWVDQNLSAGDRWDDEIKTHMAGAHIALILVSQAFLDSRYCVDIEIAEFLEKRRKDGLRIFPVVLSACEWERHRWLADHQCLPGGDETIEEHYAEPGQRKRLYSRIRKELRQMVEQIRQAGDKHGVDTAGEQLAERRRVTMLHCALYLEPRNGALDPDDESELLFEVAPHFRDRVQDQIRALDGSLVGDNAGGLLGCFGYPNLHDDDRLRAARAGLGIVRAITAWSGEFQSRTGVGLTVRVGIQSGSVISSSGAGIANELERGEVQSMAVLLQANAPPDSVVVGDATYKPLRGFFEAEPVATLDHPTLRKKVPGWRLTRDLAIKSRFHAARLQGLTPLVAREQELGLIRNAWASAIAGSGRMVVLTAEAGIGKSRLLDEFRRSIAAQKHFLIECQCSPHHQNSALFPIEQALRAWLDVKPEDSNQAQLRKIEKAFAGTSLTANQVAAVTDLLGVAAPSVGLAPQLSAKQQKEHTFESLLLLLAERASVHPILIAVEDLHWTDPSTEEFLGRLLEEIEGLPILAVCTARPEFHLPAGWAERDQCLPVKMGPLSAAQMAEMISRVTGGKNLPGDLLILIMEKTEGYPLFVEDLTRMVIESDLLVEENDAYVAKGSIQVLAIPDTLEETLMARLSTVGGARLVAQLGAVIGREFTGELIAAIAPMDGEALKESLGKLVAAGILHRRGLTGRTHYVFKHALALDALYRSLLKRDRKRYHAQIAQAIERLSPGTARNQPELMAHHYWEGGLPEQAIQWWIAASVSATRKCASVEALAHAAQALNAMKDVPDPAVRGRLELQVQVIRGPALLAAAGWSSPEIGATYRRAKELLQFEENIANRARITRGLWGYYMVSSQLQDSLQLSAELMHLADDADSDDYRLEAHVTFCDSYFWIGKPELSVEHAEQGLRLYDLDRDHLRHSEEYGEDPSVIFHCYGAIGSWLIGNTARAEQIVAAAIADIERYTHLFSRGFLLNGVAWYYVHTGRAELAYQYGKALKDLSTENDFPPWLALARTHCGWAMGVLGEVEAGAQELRGGMKDIAATGGAITRLLNAALLADVYMRAGRHDEANEAVLEGLAHAPNTEERHYLPELHRLRAELLRLTGGPADEAERHFQTAISIAREQHAVALEQRASASLTALANQ